MPEMLKVGIIHFTIAKSEPHPHLVVAVTTISIVRINVNAWRRDVRHPAVSAAGKRNTKQKQEYRYSCTRLYSVFSHNFKKALLMDWLLPNRRQKESVV
jgi:hypothetical protein